MVSKTESKSETTTTQCIRDDKNTKDQKEDLINGLKAFRNEHNLSTFNLEDHDDDGEDDGYEDEEDERVQIYKAEMDLGQANNSKSRQC